MNAKTTIICSIVFLLAGCATKNFEKLPDIEPSVAEKMSCDDIEQEFFKLSQYEDGVDEEASTGGRFKQILWGGLWSAMADEKLESVAHKDIREQIRFLYDLKIKKKCS